jgi:hypothetical protein
LFETGKINAQSLTGIACLHFENKSWGFETMVASKTEAIFRFNFWKTEAKKNSEAWCPEEDSNLHTLRHTDLNRARLPIPPSGHSIA